MEYLPDGDLHGYLRSPLPEGEGQNIVSQILEGLDFMHDNGFAHRFEASSESIFYSNFTSSP